MAFNTYQYEFTGGDRTEKVLSIDFVNVYPLQNVYKINFFKEDDVSGTFQSKRFRYSFDNVIWSNWNTLSQSAVKNIPINDNPNLFLHFNYLRANIGSASIRSLYILYDTNISLLASPADPSIDADYLGGQPPVYYLNRENHFGPYLDLFATNVSGDGIGVYDSRVDSSGSTRLYFKKIRDTSTVLVSEDVSGFISLDASTGGVWSKDASNNIFYNDGNVGIGTTNPLVKLHVNGTIQIDGSLYFNDASISIISEGNDLIFTDVSVGSKSLSELVSGSLQTLSYDELEVIISASELVVGQQYLITDYKTKHQIPNTTDVSEGSIEPIIATANTTNTLYERVISTIYSGDEIWYDFSDNICEDASTPRKGRITFRRDTQKDIECFYDWREVIFRRWQCGGLYHHDTSINVNTFDASIVYGAVDATPSRYREYYINFGDASHGPNPELTLIKTNTVTRELVRPDGTSFTGANDLQTYLGASNFGLVYYSPLLDKYAVTDNETENNMVKDKYILFSDSDITTGNGTRLIVNSGVYTDARTFIDADPAIKDCKIGLPISGNNYSNIRFDSLTNVANFEIGGMNLNMTFPHGGLYQTRMREDCNNLIIMGTFAFCDIGNQLRDSLIATTSSGNRTSLSTRGGSDSWWRYNSHFIRSSAYNTSVKQGNFNTFRIWPSGSNVQINRFQKVGSCFLNLGLTSAITFRNNNFKDIENKAFEGAALSWSGVTYSPASVTVESYDFSLSNENFNPFETQVLNITDTNATDAFAIASGSKEIIATLDASLSADWTPSSITGMYSRRTYKFIFKKDVEQNINLINTTNVEFPEQSGADPSTGINPFASNFLDVSVGDEAWIDALAKTNGKLLFNQLIF